jgi:hypothetical protein
MATEQELINEVRVFTGYDTNVLHDDAFKTVVKRARKRLQNRCGLDSEFDFYDDTAEDGRQDALFWWTCLFAKLATGELDSQELNVAAIDIDNLEAETTRWFREALAAETGIGDTYRMGITGPTRTDREYTGGSGTGTGSGSSPFGSSGGDVSL